MPARYTYTPDSRRRAAVSVLATTRSSCGSHGTTANGEISVILPNLRQFPGTKTVQRSVVPYAKGSITNTVTVSLR
eukprot:3227530-Rhodomonas_salina.2